VNTTAEHRWKSHPWLARVLRLAMLVVPFVCSIVAAMILAQSLPAADRLWTKIARFVVIAALSTLVLFGVDRLVRRLMPLARLLDLTLVFPDKVPSRYSVALRGGTVRSLRTRAGAEPGDQSVGVAEDLLAMIGSLRTHDRMTRGHTERVRAYSEMIGKEMGLDRDELDRLRWGALLHDIGKLKVPPEILNKPDKLDDAEFAVMRSHPMSGKDLALPVGGWLGDSLNAVWEHHEKWDGSGYPQGLAGEQISLPGRIVAVADAYDVMTSTRSYKTPKSAAWAREELARCAGTHFDPAVVRAFMNISIGRLQFTLGPMSWFAQLAFVPKAFTSNPAAPIGAAVVVGVVASALGVGAAGGSDVARPDSRPAPVTVAESAPNGSPVVEAGGGESEPATAPVSVVPSESTAAPTSPVATSVATTSGVTTAPVRVTVPALPPIGTSPRTVRPPSPTAPRTSVPPTRPVPTSVITTTTSRTPDSTSPSSTSTSTTVVSTTSVVTTSTSPTSTSTTTTAPPPTGLVLRLASSGAGDVSSSPTLPLVIGGSAQNAGAVPNYDTDRNSDPGLTLQPAGAAPLDSASAQRFSFTPTEPMQLGGPASLRLTLGDAGLDGDAVTVIVGVYDCTQAGSCTLLASDTESLSAAGFQSVVFDLGDIDRTIPSNRRLQLRVATTDASSGDVWLLYDYTSAPSALSLTPR
jgi:HD-GYP domain-containing protein (c-di-GMP phosphodiesterase class II)